MKLAVNISLAEQMLAFSEGVLLAEQGGIDRALAVSVLKMCERLGRRDRIDLIVTVVVERHMDE